MNVLLQNLIPLLVFAACVLAVVSLYLIWDDAQKSGAEQVKSRIRRLSAAAAEEVDIKKSLLLARQEGLSALDAALMRLSRLHNFDRFLVQSGVQFGPATYAFICLWSGGACTMVFAIFMKSLTLMPLGLGFLLGFLVPWLILQRKRNQRIERITKQVPDTLDFFARILRAGTPFSGAIKLASEEMPQPIAGELAITFDELSFGLSFDEAMHNFATRVETEEVRLFVTAVLVQKSTGGNLAELLNRLSKLLRDRITAFGEIKVQAAEMRTSARVLVLLPIVMAAVLLLVNPDHFKEMLELRSGRIMIAVQLCLMVAGYFITNRMVSFRV